MATLNLFDVLITRVSQRCEDKKAKRLQDFPFLERPLEELAEQSMNVPITNNLFQQILLPVIESEAQKAAEAMALRKQLQRQARRLETLQRAGTPQKLAEEEIKRKIVELDAALADFDNLIRDGQPAKEQQQPHHQQNHSLTENENNDIKQKQPQESDSNQPFLPETLLANDSSANGHIMNDLPPAEIEAEQEEDTEAIKTDSTFNLAAARLDSCLDISHVLSSVEKAKRFQQLAMEQDLKVETASKHLHDMIEKLEKDRVDFQRNYLQKYQSQSNSVKIPIKPPTLQLDPEIMRLVGIAPWNAPAKLSKGLLILDWNNFFEPSPGNIQLEDIIPPLNTTMYRKVYKVYSDPESIEKPLQTGFKRNPRNEKVKEPACSTMTKKKQDLLPSKAPLNDFESFPQTLIFDDFEPGRKHEKTLYIKNSSKITRKFRLNVEDSKFFKLFPVKKDANLCQQQEVAPGLSVAYKVEFYPESGAKHEYELTVEEETGKTFKVQIMGKRPEPILTIPTTLDIGSSLFSLSVDRIFEFKNKGGKAHFRFLEESQLPGDGMFSIGDESESVEVGPFTIRPKSFFLDSNQKAKLKISYQPLKSRADSILLEDKIPILIFNDQLVKCQYMLSGVGELCDVSISTTETDYLETEDLQNQSIFKKRCTINFKSQDLHQTSEGRLVLKNHNGMPLKFSWKVYEKDSETQLSSEIFKILPENGEIKSKETQSFRVLFQPEAARHYEYLSKLMVTHSVSLDSQDKQSQVDSGISLTIRGQGKIPKTTLIPSSFRTIPGLKTNLYLNNSSEIMCELGANFMYPRLVARFDSIDFGLLYPFERKRTSFILANEGQYKSDWSLKYVIENIDRNGKADDSAFNRLEKHDLDYLGIDLFDSLKEDKETGIVYPGSFVMIEPSQGSIDPGQSLTIDVVFIPTTIQRFRAAILIDSNPKPVRIHTSLLEPLPSATVQLRAEVQAPMVELLESIIDLDLVYYKTTICRNATLVNKTCFPTRFLCFDLENDFVLIKFRNKEGILDAMQTLQVPFDMTFKKIPVEKEGIICEGDWTLDIYVEDMGLLELHFKGKVVGFEAKFQSNDGSGSYGDDNQYMIQFGDECQVHEFQSRSFVIENPTGVESSFTIDIDHEKRAMEGLQIHVEPITGKLIPFAKHEIQVQIKSDTPGRIKSPIFVNIESIVRQQINLVLGCAGGSCGFVSQKTIGLQLDPANLLPPMRERSMYPCGLVGTVSFGAIFVGPENMDKPVTVERRVYVKNHSSCGVKLDFTLSMPTSSSIQVLAGNTKDFSLQAKQCDYIILQVTVKEAGLFEGTLVGQVTTTSPTLDEKNANQEISQEISKRTRTITLHVKGLARYRPSELQVGDQLWVSS